MKLRNHFKPFYFFMKIFLHIHKKQNTNKRLSLKYFYTPKKYLKSIQATFTHKKHKISNKLCFIRLKSIKKAYKQLSFIKSIKCQISFVLDTFKSIKKHTSNFHS